VTRSGETTTFSPHLGLEGEPISDWLQARIGSYLEPSRFRGGSTRVHGTTGFDVRLFDWSALGLADDRAALRLGGSIDVSREYFGWGVSLGAWR